MGRGTSRKRRWSRLKDFINNINVNLLKGVEHEYMVYNIEPRILDDLASCDKATELFTIADECLCNKKFQITSDGSGCSVNQPTNHENMEDWGKTGPMAGKALQKAKKMYFSKDNEKYKNVILLLSHKQSADDIERVERDLKASGISLIDIELGQRHDLKRKSEIPRPLNSDQQLVRHKNVRRSVVVPHLRLSVSYATKYGKTLLRSQKRHIVPKKRSSPILSVKQGVLFKPKVGTIKVQEITPQRPTIKVGLPTSTATALTSTKSRFKKDRVNTMAVTPTSLIKTQRSVKRMRTSLKIGTRDSKRGEIRRKSDFSRETLLATRATTSPTSSKRDPTEEFAARKKQGEKKKTISSPTSKEKDNLSGSSSSDTHKVKVSLKKLTQTLKDIIGKVCTTKTTDDETRMKKRSIRSVVDFY